MIAELGGVALFLSATSGASVAGGRPWLTLVLVGGGLFACGVYLYCAGALVFKQSLSTMATYLDRVGNGDLALHFLPGWGKVSEGQQVWTALNKMNKEFPEIVRQVRTTAEMIASGSREVAIGYTDLSQRTDEQAATL